MTSPVSRTAFVNSRIYTVDAARSWADAMLVEDGQIVRIGASRDILESVEADADIVDLGGRMVMPGIHDAHTHLLAAGLKFRFECRLDANSGTDQIVNALCDCEKCRRGKLSGWLIGGEYNANIFPDGGPDRTFLDDAFPGTAVYLYDLSIHHGFANSRALALAGIDANTPDPPGGRIVRRAGSREPTGELIERATWKLKRTIPQYDPDIYREAVSWAIAVSNRFGITSLQEAGATLPELRVLNNLDSEGALTAHVATHLIWREEAFGNASQEDMEALIQARARYASGHVRTDFLKCWLDGAPVPPHFTQSNLDPTTGMPDDKLVISEAELTDALLVFDRQNLPMKIHCAGDGAVRAALNAVEAVRKANGSGGPRHEIAHALFVHPDDMGRFAQLNVGAEMSPAVWHIRIPEFAGLDAGCKFATLNEAGAQVTIGSDWIATETPNLFPALQGMLDRGAESVPLETALEMMTIAGAKAVGMDQRTGSLEVGKLADFIVLDRNLFDIPVTDIGGTNVLRTVFEGRTVFQQP
jgi:predicted amidohydrolase YtcJ